MGNTTVLGNRRFQRASAVAAGAAVLAIGSATGIWNAQASPSLTAPTFKLQIGQPGSAFVYPWGMAFDSASGTILTTDYNNYQVRRFSTSGTPLAVYSNKAALNTQQPYSIVVDSSTDNFLVDDLEGYLRYSSTGILLNSVTAQTLKVPYYAPWMTVNSATSDVYVANSNSATGHNFVLMYNGSDSFLGEFGTTGTSCSLGQFGLIRGMDVDSSGNVYVNDVTNNCVQVFSSTGTFLRYFSTKAGLPTKNQTSGNTRGLTIDRANNMVYVTDAGQAERRCLHHCGNIRRRHRQSRIELRRRRHSSTGLRDTAIGTNGTVYESDYACFNIDAYNPLFASSKPGGFIGSIPTRCKPPPAGGLNQAVGVAVSPIDGTVYVSDTFNQRIQEFQGLNGTTPGAFVQMWGSRQPSLSFVLRDGLPAWRRGRFQRQPVGEQHVAPAGSRNTHLPATATGRSAARRPRAPRSARCRSSAAKSRRGHASTCSPGKFFYARGIFVGGPSNDVYVPDSDLGRLQVLTQAGKEVQVSRRMRRDQRDNPGAVQGCTGVTVNSTTGTIYAVSVTEGLIDVFSPTGTLLRQIGAAANMRSPFDDALSPDGSILYVTDTYNNRIDEFNPSTGAFLGSWGSKGSTNGKFVQPMGIAVDPSGNIYVNDYGNDRVEVFAPAA